MCILQHLHLPCISDIYYLSMFKPQAAFQITITSVLYLHILYILSTYYITAVYSPNHFVPAHFSVFRMCFRTNQYLYPVMPMTGMCQVFN